MTQLHADQQNFKGKTAHLNNEIDHALRMEIRKEIKIDPSNTLEEINYKLELMYKDNEDLLEIHS